MSTMHHGRRLPTGWVKCESARYKPHSYFFDTQTGKTTWFPPDNDAEYESSGTRQLEGGSSPPSAKRLRSDDGLAISAKAKIAIIVPYRDLDVAQRRAAHLEQFIPHMEFYMRRLQVLYHIYVVEQSKDERKFNRGKLLNIGFDIAKTEGCNSFIFHDVDLLPSIELGRWYSTAPQRPVHVAKVWKQYSNNPKYFGGVVAFNQMDFEAINGFPNTFWGWGGEDDEMYSRLVELGIEPDRADEGEFTDLEGLDIASKLDLLRKNEQWKCQVKQEALKEHSQTWHSNGLADLKYDVLNRQSLAESVERVIVDVRWNDHWTDTITRWQDLPKQPPAGSS